MKKILLVALFLGFAIQYNYAQTTRDTFFYDTHKIEEINSFMEVIIDDEKMKFLVGERVRYNENGDTIFYEVYPNKLNIEFIQNYGESRPIKTIFFTRENDILVKKEQFITSSWDDYEGLHPDGWQFYYYDDNNILKSKIYYEIPKSKKLIQYRDDEYGTYTYANKSISFYESGILKDSTIIENNIIIRYQYFANGNIKSYSTKKLNNVILLDIEYDENGIEVYKKINKKNTFYIYNNGLLVGQYYRDKKIEIDYYLNGNPYSKKKDSIIKFYSYNGKFVLADTVSPSTRYPYTKYTSNKYIYSDYFISQIKTVKRNEKINAKHLDFFPLYTNDGIDTLILYKGKLLQEKFYKIGIQDTVLTKSYDYAARSGYNSYGGEYEYFTDYSDNFKEYKVYRNNILTSECILIDSLSGCYIYNKTKYNSYNGAVKEKEYRNYYDSTFYLVITGYQDGKDSISISHLYVPKHNENLVDYSLYTDAPHKHWRYNAKSELISFYQSYSDIEQNELNYPSSIYYNYFNDSIVDIITHSKDTVVNEQYGLYGNLLSRKTSYLRNGEPFSVVQNFSYFNFDQINIAPTIPDSPNGIYTSLWKTYDFNRKYSLNANKYGDQAYIWDKSTQSIIYQNPSNIPNIENNVIIFKTEDELFGLFDNVVYSFKLDSTIGSLDKNFRPICDGNNEVFLYNMDNNEIFSIKKVDLFEKKYSNIKTYIYFDLNERAPSYRYKMHYIDNNQIFYNERSNTINIFELDGNSIIIHLESKKIDTIFYNSFNIPANDLDNFYNKQININGEYFVYTQQSKNGDIIGFKVYNINNSTLSTFFLKHPIKYHDFNDIDIKLEQYGEDDVYGPHAISKRDELVTDFELKIINGELYLISMTNRKHVWKEFGIETDTLKKEIYHIDLLNHNVTKIEPNLKTSNNSHLEQDATYKTDVIKASSLFENYYIILFENHLKVIDLRTGKLTDQEEKKQILAEWKEGNKRFNRVISPIPLIDKEIANHLFNSNYILDKENLYSSIFSSHDSINSKHMLTNTNRYHESITILWNGDNENQVERQIVVGFINGRLIFYSPEFYYMSPNNAEYFLKSHIGLTVYPFEQFDLKYNRPDIILDRLGYSDSSLVNAYHAAYQKRLKKMGFTEDMLKDDFHLPEIKIENFEEFPAINDNGSIYLKLKLEDTKYKLDRINVWVNDVAIYGANGISLRDKNVQEYSTNLSVDLAKGKNKVQVSVLNQAGAESYKETFEIECSAGKNTPDLYLITIGVSEFEQTDFNLTYAAKDAQDMTTLFEKSKAYNKVFSKTLLNQNVTKENVLALKSFLAKAGINDEVLIFIAGHGVLDTNLDYYLATYDTDFQQPQNRGLAYDDLENLLDGIKPLKKTLIIDACHSGEIDKEEIELAQVDVNEGDDIHFRAVGNSVAPKLGIQNTSELVKTLFTDLRKGSGATVISSAGGMEFAMEGDDWSNGLFTYCLIKGITSGDADLNNDGEIWLSEIQQYVAEQVTKLSNGQQQPTSRIENQIVDFRVW